MSKSPSGISQPTTKLSEEDNKRIGALFAAKADILATGLKQGEIVCTLCRKGKLRFSVAPNGHTRGACEEPECLRWIE